MPQGLAMPPGRDSLRAARDVGTPIAMMLDYTNPTQEVTLGVGHDRREYTANIPTN